MGMHVTNVEGLATGLETAQTTDMLLGTDAHLHFLQQLQRMAYCDSRHMTKVWRSTDN